MRSTPRRLDTRTCDPRAGRITVRLTLWFQPEHERENTMRLAFQTIGQLKRVATMFVCLSIFSGYLGLLGRFVS